MKHFEQNLTGTTYTERWLAGCSSIEIHVFLHLKQLILASDRSDRLKNMNSDWNIPCRLVTRYNFEQS